MKSKCYNCGYLVPAEASACPECDGGQGVWPRLAAAVQSPVTAIELLATIFAIGGAIVAIWQSSSASISADEAQRALAEIQKGGTDKAEQYYGLMVALKGHEWNKALAMSFSEKETAAIEDSYAAFRVVGEHWVAWVSDGGRRIYERELVVVEQCKAELARLRNRHKLYTPEAFGLAEEDPICNYSQAWKSGVPYGADGLFSWGLALDGNLCGGEVRIDQRHAGFVMHNYKEVYEWALRLNAAQSRVSKEEMHRPGAERAQMHLDRANETWRNKAAFPLIPNREGDWTHWDRLRPYRD
jgi:hypothetical protein